MPATPIKSSTNSSARTQVTSSGRKVPHCRQCNRPRAGHPRTGCPYASRSDQRQVSDDTDTEAEDGEDDDLNSAFKSVNLEVAGGSPKKTPLRRHHSNLHDTVASISTDGKAIFAQLELPEAADRISEEGKHLENKNRIREWVANIPLGVEDDPSEPSGKRRERDRTMPCTLDTPGSSFAFEDEKAQVFEDIKPATHSNSGGSSEELASAVANTVKGKGRALTRSMSAEERSTLFHNLDNASATPPAALYTLPKSEVEDLQSSATKLGFATLVISHINDNFCYMVVGKDTKAVNALYDSLRTRFGGIEVTVVKDNKGMSKLSLAAAAAVGAAATLTGLAFS